MPNIYRPWGPLEWILPQLPGDSWSLLGVLGTEDRCVATLMAMKTQLMAKKFLKVLDPHMSPAAAFDERFLEIQRRLEKEGLAASDISTVDLLQDIDTIKEELDSFIQASGSRIIIDITSMPKRWFFPITRFILQYENLSTIIFTYTSAETYEEQLSSDPAALGPLPTFDGPRDADSYDELVVGVGFAPLGLRDIFEVDIGKVRYLFPFPPGPPNFFRNWDFLRSLEAEMESRNPSTENRWQVDMYDVSNAFNALCNITKNGDRTCALAPFGPKTLSLAMCLFALAADGAAKEPVHVYYTQPRRYALKYTSGIKLSSGVPDIKAYCVRIDGRNLYEL